MKLCIDTPYLTNSVEHFHTAWVRDIDIEIRKVHSISADLLVK